MLANLFGILFLAGVGSYMWRSVPPKPFVPIFNIQDGKQRSLQAKGDAGLYIEKVRRRTVQQVGRLDPRKLRETKTQFGSATGVIETFMITGLCDPLPCPCPPDILFDGGGVGADFCPIPGTGNLDAGNNKTLVCESCPPDTIFDGGGVGANFKPIKGSGILYGKFHNTKACGI